MKKVLREFIKNEAIIIQKIMKKREKTYSVLLNKVNKEFGKDALFIHDVISQIISINHLDKNNLDVRNALMQMAIGVKKKFTKPNGIIKTKPHE